MRGLIRAGVNAGKNVGRPQGHFPYADTRLIDPDRDIAGTSTADLSRSLLAEQLSSDPSPEADPPEVDPSEVDLWK